uniref:Uncharacterized protein n=1 Tax=Panagrolaimus sp. PS1159 TaxID=55785 RepID=A0AC35GTL7_9BILA
MPLKFEKIFTTVFAVLIICQIAFAQWQLPVVSCSGPDITPNFCTQECVSSDFTRFNYGECTNPTTCTCYWVEQ